MPMPNRTLLGPEGYRYAFQGQEKDPETGKEAFQLRLWDGRIGRWLTTDPYGQYNSPYVGMGNDPINGIDPDGGYKTKWQRFWAWVGGGFKGTFVNNKDASNPYKAYGIQTTSVDADGGVTGMVSYGDWKAEAASDLMADIRFLEFEEKYMTTYDTRAEAIASAFQVTLPNAPNLPRFKLPKIFKSKIKLNQKSFQGLELDDATDFLNSNGWTKVTELSNESAIVWVRKAGELKEYLRYNMNGRIHSADKINPAKYWKLSRGRNFKNSNNNVVWKAGVKNYVD